MRVPSLFDIAAKSVVEYLIDGTLPPFNGKLPAVFSNHVLRKLCLLTIHPINKWTVQEICKVLDFTELDMDNGFGRGIDVSELKKHDFKSLRITKYINVWEFLNSSAKQGLLHLDISECPSIIDRDWCRDLAINLPCLTSLNMAGKSIYLIEFRYICNNCHELRALNISDTKLSTLTGISGLSKLEHLSIANLEFRRPSYIIEIFELKQLKFLDISSQDRRSDMLHLFLLCNRVLPNLKYLECFETRATQIQIRQLIETHNTIIRVGVVGTLVEEFDYPPVEILNIWSLKSAAQTLQYYLDVDNQDKIVLVNEEIHYKYLGSATIHTLDPNAQQDLISVMCSIMEKFPMGHRCNLAAVNNLSLFNTWKVRNISSPEHSRLISVLTAPWFFWAYFSAGSRDQDYLILIEFWTTLYELISNNDIDIDHQLFFENSIDILSEGGTGELEEICFKTIEIVLRLRASSLEPTSLDIVFKSSMDWKIMLCMLNRFYHKKNRVWYKNILSLLEALTKLSVDYFAPAGGVNLLMKHFKNIQSGPIKRILRRCALNGLGRSQFYEHQNTRILIKAFVNLSKQRRSTLRDKKLSRVLSITNLVVRNADEEQNKLQNIKTLNKLINAAHSYLIRDERPDLDDAEHEPIPNKRRRQ